MTSNKEDLGIKIGTKKEAYWANIKNKCEEGIFQAEQDIEINKTLMKFAEEKISEEKK